MKLNIQLEQARDLAAPLSGLFAQMSGILGRFQGTGVQGVAAVFQNIQAAMESLSKFHQTLAEYGGPHGLFGSITGSFKMMIGRGTYTAPAARKTAQQIFDEGLNRSANTMDRLSVIVTELTQKLQQLRDAVSLTGQEKP